MSMPYLAHRTAMAIFPESGTAARRGTTHAGGTVTVHVGDRTVLRHATVPNLVGTVSGTTITTTQAESSLRGRMVRAENGDAEGQMRRIVEVSGGVSHGIDRAFNPSGATTTQWSVWEVTDAIRATAGGTTTTMISSDLPQADAYFVGWYLLDIDPQSTNYGESRLISAFDAAADQITCAAFTNATTSGTVYAIVQPVFSLADSSMSLEATHIDQDAATGDATVVESVPGPKVWSGQVTVPWRGLVTAAGSGVAASPDAELDILLGAQMRRLIVTGQAVVAGSGGNVNSTTRVVVTENTETQFPVGTLILVNGQLVQVTATAEGDVATGDNLTVHPALTAAAVAADVAYGTACWSRLAALDLVETRGLIQWLGSERMQIGWGGAWAGKLLALARAEIPRWQFALTGGPATEYTYPLGSGSGELPYTPTLPAKVSRAATRMIAVIGSQGASSHATDAMQIISLDEIDLGFTPQRGDEVTGLEGTGSVFVTRGKPSIRLTAWMTNDNFESWERRSRLVSCLIQIGHVPTQVLGIAAHRCEVRETAIGEANGGHTVSMTLTPLSSGITNVGDIVIGQG